MPVLHNLKEKEEKQKQQKGGTNPRKGMETAFHFCCANVPLQQWQTLV